MSFEDDFPGLEEQQEEWELQETEEQLVKLAKAQQRLAQKEAQRQQQAFLDSTFNEALKAHGLTPEEYNAFGVEVQDEIRQVIRDGMHRMAEVAAQAKKRRARGPDGRFISNAQAQQIRQGQQPGQGQVAKPQKSVDEILEARRSGTINPDAALDGLLEHLIPPGDPIAEY